MALTLPRPSSKAKGFKTSYPDSWPDTLDQDPRIVELTRKLAEATQAEAEARESAASESAKVDQAQGAFDAVERRWLLNEVSRSAVDKAATDMEPVKLDARRAEVRHQVALEARDELAHALTTATALIAHERRDAYVAAINVARLNLYHSLLEAAEVNDRLYELCMTAEAFGFNVSRHYLPNLGGDETKVPMTNYDGSLGAMQRELRAVGLLK